MTTILGIDPGGMTGLALVQWHPDYPDTLGFTVIPWEVRGLRPGDLMGIVNRAASDARRQLLVACEDFVLRGLNGRRTHTGPKATLDLIGAVRTVSFPHVLRPAAAVKPWASDKRLAAAFGPGAFRGLPHAADAARHALYAGVRDFGWPDPLVLVTDA